MVASLSSPAIFSAALPYLSAAYVVTTIGVCALIVMENRNPLKSLAWITVLLLLPGLGLVFYLVFGRSIKNQRMISRRRRRRLLKDEAPPAPLRSQGQRLSPEARVVSTTAKAVGGAPLYDGNTVDIFDNGIDKFNALLADLDNARRYVLVQYYIFNDDTIGSRVQRALIDCARRGVKVRVIYDDLGCIGVKKRFFRDMERAGIDAHPFFKLTFPQFASRANWRNHRKLCVIDGAVGYIGGMNIADRYASANPSAERWRDTHIRVTGPVVASLHYSFAVDWNFMGQAPITEPVGPSAASPGGVAMQLIAGGPTDRWGNLSLFLLKAITAAKKRVWIQTPYFLPSQTLLNALQVAALSRIDVRVMMPRRSDSRLLTFASRSFIQECLRAGVKVYLYDGGMLHSKTMIVDDDIATVGSTNFDFRSFEHNFEANMLICSPEVNSRLRALFDTDILESERIVFHQWRSRPLRHKIAESVMRLFSPVL